MRQVLNPIPLQGVLQVLALRFPTGEANTSVMQTAPDGHAIDADQFAVQ